MKGNESATADRSPSVVFWNRNRIKISKPHIQSVHMKKRGEKVNTAQYPGSSVGLGRVAVSIQHLVFDQSQRENMLIEESISWISLGAPFFFNHMNVGLKYRLNCNPPFSIVPQLHSHATTSLT
jgi:hypothetical protein